MRRKWTEQEKNYLNKRYCKQPVATTAKVLGRTVVSVKRKARSLGLNIYAGEFVSARTVAKCFGQDIRVVLRWITKFGLPATERRVANVTRYEILPEMFWQWAKDHRDEIHWASYEPLSLLPEPDWLEETRNAYKYCNHHKRVSHWDRMRISEMLRHGATFREIGDGLGRTTESAKHIARTYHL